MLTSARFRLYPTKVQREAFAAHFGCARWVYNWGLEQCQKSYAETGKHPRYYDLQRSLPALKAENEWLKGGNAQSLQVALQNLTTAFERFFAKASAYPRFKKRHGPQSVTFPQDVRKLDLKPNGWAKLRLPKIGLIRVKAHRPIPGTIKAVTVSQDTAGRYWAALRIDTGVEVRLSGLPNDAVGIDLGLTHFATLSTGKKIDAPQLFRRAERNLGRKKTAWNRTQKGSANREKARLRFARASAKVERCRADFLHKLSRRLVDENQAICVEKLNVRGLMHNHKVAKSIADAGWYEFTQMLRYKAAAAGKPFAQCGRHYPSSKTCHACKHVLPKLSWDARVWDCPKCGATHDRDINAALNIRDEGLRIMAEGYPVTASGRNVSRWKPSSLARSRLKEEARKGSITAC